MAPTTASVSAQRAPVPRSCAPRSGTLDLACTGRLRGSATEHRPARPRARHVLRHGSSLLAEHDQRGAGRQHHSRCNARNAHHSNTYGVPRRAAYVRATATLRILCRYRPHPGPGCPKRPAARGNSDVGSLRTGLSARRGHARLASARRR